MIDTMLVASSSPMASPSSAGGGTLLATGALGGGFGTGGNTARNRVASSS
jgi:hypothetical protein